MSNGSAEKIGTFLQFPTMSRTVSFSHRHTRPFCRIAIEVSPWQIVEQLRFINLLVFLDFLGDKSVFVIIIRAAVPGWSRTVKIHCSFRHLLLELQQLGKDPVACFFLNIGELPGTCFVALRSIRRHRCQEC